MQKRGNERPRSWLASVPWLLILMIGCAFTWWMTAREPTYRTLTYGEFLQVLAAARSNPALVLQKVQVNHGDIRGEVVATDPVSNGTDNGRQVTTLPFRTLRSGLETDLDLTRRLETVGAAFQGGEEDTALRGLVSLITTVLMLGLFTILLLFAVRWLSKAQDTPGRASMNGGGRATAEVFV